MQQLTWPLLSAFTIIICPLYALIPMLLFAYLVIHCFRYHGVEFVSHRQLTVNCIVSIAPFILLFIVSRCLNSIIQYIAKMEIPWIKICAVQVVGHSLGTVHWYLQSKRKEPVVHFTIQLTPGLDSGSIDNGEEHAA